MRAKIIGFTQKDGHDWDCKAITDKGEQILVDPFAGCAWDYKQREHLLNQWFNDEEAFLSKDGECWLLNEKTFRLEEMK